MQFTHSAGLLAVTALVVSSWANVSLSAEDPACTSKRDLAANLCERYAQQLLAEDNRRRAPHLSTMTIDQEKGRVAYYIEQLRNCPALVEESRRAGSRLFDRYVGRNRTPPGYVTQDINACLAIASAPPSGPSQSAGNGGPSGTSFDRDGAPTSWNSAVIIRSIYCSLASTQSSVGSIQVWFDRVDSGSYTMRWSERDGGPRAYYGTDDAFPKLTNDKIFERSGWKLKSPNPHLLALISERNEQNGIGMDAFSDQMKNYSAQVSGWLVNGGEQVARGICTQFFEHGASSSVQPFDDSTASSQPYTDGVWQVSDAGRPKKCDMTDMVQVVKGGESKVCAGLNSQSCARSSFAKIENIRYIGKGYYVQGDTGPSPLRIYLRADKERRALVVDRVEIKDVRAAARAFGTLSNAHQRASLMIGNTDYFCRSL